MLKLTNATKPFEIEDGKRFNLPGAKLEGECPSCKAPFKIDFRDRYLSYPKANAVNKVQGYCDKCEHEWDIKVRLNVSLELVP